MTTPTKAEMEENRMRIHGIAERMLSPVAGEQAKDVCVAALQVSLSMLMGGGEPRSCVEAHDALIKILEVMKLSAETGLYIPPEKNSS